MTDNLLGNIYVLEGRPPLGQHATCLERNREVLQLYNNINFHRSIKFELWKEYYKTVWSNPFIVGK